MYDIIIIGGGIAGLSSAIFALRNNKKVLLLEEKIHGGQIINTNKITNYPGILQIDGPSLANILLNQAKKLDLEIKYEETIKINKKTIVTNQSIYKYKTLIIATGAKNKKLNIKNNFNDQGISYCAYCDANFYKNKIVAVIGGGKTAIQEAIYLSNIAKKVYLIHRSPLKHQINPLKKIQTIPNEIITELIGQTKIEKIKLKNKIIKVDGLFVAIGQNPNTDFIKNQLNLDNNGYIIADETTKTNIPNIFAAGDVRTKEVRQLITAASDGAIAAIQALKYLENS